MAALTAADLENLPAKLRVPEAARVLRMADRTAYRQIKDGRFPVRVFGGDGTRQYVLGADLAKHLTGAS